MADQDTGGLTSDASVRCVAPEWLDVTSVRRPPRFVFVDAESADPRHRLQHSAVQPLDERESLRGHLYEMHTGFWSLGDSLSALSSLFSTRCQSHDVLLIFFVHPTTVQRVREQAC